MNSELNPSEREQLEARITALLLGELPEAEAAALQQAISHDPELAHLHDELKRTVSLLPEAVADQESLRLSNARREKLLGSFKVLRPRELCRGSERKADLRTWLALAAMIAVLLIFAAALLPELSRSRSKSQYAAVARKDLPEAQNLRGFGVKDLVSNLEIAQPKGNISSGEVAPLQGTTAESAAATGVTDSPASPRPIREEFEKAQVAEGKREPSVNAATPPPVQGGAAISRSISQVGKPAKNVNLDDVATKLQQAKEIPEGRAAPAKLPESPAKSNRAPGSLDRSQSGAQPLTRASLEPTAPEGGGRNSGQIELPQLADSAVVEANGLEALNENTLASGEARDKNTGLAVNRGFGFGGGIAGGGYGGRAANGSTQKPKSERPVEFFGAQPGPVPPGAQHIPELAKRQVELRSFADTAAAASVQDALSPTPAASPAATPTSPIAGGLQPSIDLNTIGQGVSSIPVESNPFQAPTPGSFPSTVNAPAFEKLRAEAGKERHWMLTQPSEDGLKDEGAIALPTVQGDSVTTARDAEPNRFVGRFAYIVNSTNSFQVDARRLDGDADTLGKAFNPSAREEDAKKKVLATARSSTVENLEPLQRERDLIRIRVLQESVDTSIPQSSLVDIVDEAQAHPSKKPGLWDRMRSAVSGQVERTARIELSTDPAAGPLLGLQAPEQQYEPYFLQTQFEKIKSQRVLAKVIDKLNLQETWAKKYGHGQKLSTEQAIERLRKILDLRESQNRSLIEIVAKSDSPEEAARIANAVAEAYRDTLATQRATASAKGIEAPRQRLQETEKQIKEAQEKDEANKAESPARQQDNAPPKPAASAPIPQPEVPTSENAFSTFSLNVSDVSFKLASASLEKGLMPEPSTVRTEEFINAFDYRDSEPKGAAPIAFAWERARYPFAYGRDILRFSIKTAASGRQPGRPLNLVLLLDNSGSMERADRVQIIRECLRVLASQLQPQDKISVVAFARTARLWVDGLAGNQAAELIERVGNLIPEGGTNLEEAMNVAYKTAVRHYLTNGVNRVVLLTDGAANLGDVMPESLKKKVEDHRKQGIALDCFGIGWEGYNDDLLEVLSRNGDGRYGFVNTPEAAATEFAGQLAGALRVAASDVKVQIEFNPRRVHVYRQLGYAKHQLTKEQFRDNTVDAAEIGAAEAGNALYIVGVNPGGEGPVATVRVRFKVPGTTDYREHEWPVAYEGTAKALEYASPAMRLATCSSAFSEWLVASPYSPEVTPDRLLSYLGGVPENFSPDPRPKKLEWMIRQAKSLSGK